MTFNLERLNRTENSIKRFKKYIKKTQNINGGIRMDYEIKEKIKYGFIGAIIITILYVIVHKKYSMEDIEKVFDKFLNKFKKYFNKVKK